jgi:hypothetical protein
VGWVCEHAPAHEGFFVAVVPINSWQFRELGYPRPRWEPDAADVEQEVRIVQAACVCGWRSARIIAPRGSSWFPNYVEIPLARLPTPMFPRGEEHLVEREGRELWIRHTHDHDRGSFPALVLP